MIEKENSTSKVELETGYDYFNVNLILEENKDEVQRVELNSTDSLVI